MSIHSALSQTNLTKQQIYDKLNRPIHDLRISVIDRCNFRCPYCMPENEYSKHYQFLKNNEWLSFDEITRLVQAFVNIGVTKIRITGGEPLLRPNLSDLIYKLNQLSGIEDLALTTNGSLLSQQANDLKKAGIKRLTVSLDSLDSNTFKKMSGAKGDVETVLKGIQVAEECGFDSIKINVVVQKGMNEHTLIDLVDYFKNTKHILRFIEYMDVGNCNRWQSEYVVPSKEIVNLINKYHPIQPIDSNYFGEVATRYQFTDGSGEIGLISSVTEPFCGSCTRGRLSADGKFYTCLFANEGKDLRKMLREEKMSNKNLEEIIKNIWLSRNDRYSQLRSEILQISQSKHPKIEMFQIGG